MSFVPPENIRHTRAAVHAVTALRTHTRQMKGPLHLMPARVARHLLPQHPAVPHPRIASAMPVFQGRTVAPAQHVMPESSRHLLETEPVSIVIQANTLSLPEQLLLRFAWIVATILPPRPGPSTVPAMQVQQK